MTPITVTNQNMKESAFELLNNFPFGIQTLLISPICLPPNDWKSIAAKPNQIAKLEKRENYNLLQTNRSNNKTNKTVISWC